MILGNRYAIVSIVETCTAIVPIAEFSQHETCLRHTALDLCEIMICSLKAKRSC